jgi:hypothetical protein
MKMLRFVVSVVFLSLFTSGLSAQELSPAQRATLRAALFAEPAIATQIANRDDGAITVWCNGNSTTDAWLAAADGRALFEAIDVTKYDALTAGKRASWDLLLRNAPLDVGRNKIRQAVLDVWGATDSVAVLSALREKATRCQVILGGTARTTNTVTGLDRAYPFAFSPFQISTVLNGN